MAYRPYTGAALVLCACLVFTAHSALAGNPQGGCTEETHGAPCMNDGQNACSGVCLPDFTRDGGPMDCFPSSTPVLEVGGAYLPTNLDGLACAPQGGAGADCAHRCEGLQCVAQNAKVNVMCEPDGGANVCDGVCDGMGACTSTPINGGQYGRGEISGCFYVACRPFDNQGADEFPVPKGTPCSSDDGLDCLMNETCGTDGECMGETIPGCTPLMADGGSEEGDDASAPERDGSTDEDAGMQRGGDSGADATTRGDGGEAASESSSGCSMSTGDAGGTLVAVQLPLAFLLLRKRRGARRG